MSNAKSTLRQRWLAVLWWAIFGFGLLVQAFAPRLKIENNRFVIPAKLVAMGKSIRPIEIVARERRMQLLSAIFTLSGALGLAFHYHHSLKEAWLAIAHPRTR
jgi:hypothetical protein